MSDDNKIPAGIEAELDDLTALACAVRVWARSANPHNRADVALVEALDNYLGVEPATIVRPVPAVSAPYDDEEGWKDAFAFAGDEVLQ